MEWIIIAAVVIFVAIAVLAYLDVADMLLDFVTALAQLTVAAVTLTMTLLAFLINTLRRLLKKHSNALLP